MRRCRVNLPNRCYHLISRVAHRAYFLDGDERTRLVDFIRRVATFSGVKLLAYCVMANHFHAFVYIGRPETLSDAEIVRCGNQVDPFFPWCKTFRWIFARVSMSDILAKYSVYHEMDVSRFLEDFMQELESVNVEKNLRRMRLAARYSQSELSRLSGVNIRNIIQLYEQGVQDINRASASTLAALARPLACAIEDLME